MSTILRVWGIRLPTQTHTMLQWLISLFIGLQAVLFVLFVAYPELFVPFIISLLLLILFLCLLFHNPLYGFLFIVVAMIVTNHYFPFAAVLVFRERMMLISLLLLFLALSGVVGKNMLKKGTFSRPLVAVLIILFLSALYGLLRGHSRFIVAQEFEMYVYLLAYFAVVSVVDTLDDVKLIVKTILVATLIMACLAIITFFYLLQFEQVLFYKGPLGHIVYSKPAMIPRVISNAEMFFPIAVNLILGLLLFTKMSKPIKYLLVSAFVVLLFAIFISLTRGMWISTLVSLFILIGYYVYRKGRRAFPALIRVSVVAVLLFTAFIYFFTDQPMLQQIMGFGTTRISSIFQATADISLINRYQEIVQVIQSVRSHPFLGLGLGAILSWRDMLFPWIIHSTFYIHNSYFWMLLKMGIIGFGAISIVLFLFFKKAINLLRRLDSSYQRAVVLGLVTGLVSVLIFSITSPFINLGAGNFYFATAIGIISVIEKHNR